MSGGRFRGGSNRGSFRLDRSVSDLKIAGGSTAANDRKAQWEAKVRASVVKDVIRGPDDPKIISSALPIDRAEADHNRVAKTRSLPPGQVFTARPASLVVSENGGGGSQTNAALPQRRRASASALHLTGRASWEAQVRASFVSGVVRGPMDASCGRTDLLDCAKLTEVAELEETSPDGLFSARRQAIAEKVERSEHDIIQALEKIRNDLREMQEEDTTISSRLDQLREKIKDVDDQLEDLCSAGGYVCSSQQVLVDTDSNDEERSSVGGDSHSSVPTSAHDLSSCEDHVSQDIDGVRFKFPHALLEVDSSQHRPDSTSQASSASSTLSADSGLGIRSRPSSESESEHEEDQAGGKADADDVFDNFLAVTGLASDRTLRPKSRQSLLSGIHGEELVALYMRKEQSIRQELGFQDTSGSSADPGETNNDSGFIDDQDAFSKMNGGAEVNPHRGSLRRGKRAAPKLLPGQLIQTNQPTTKLPNTSARTVNQITT